MVLYSPEGQKPSALGSSQPDGCEETDTACAGHTGGRGRAVHWGRCDLSPPPNTFLFSGWLLHRWKRQDQVCPHHHPATRGLLIPLQKLSHPAAPREQNTAFI